ncbi:MAG: hypothetical protein MHM6MM_001394 [Cercozoa sp. M6MM]
MREITHGVIALHAKGLVHRDIKEANVVLSRDFSDARLIDYGVTVPQGSSNTVAGAFSYWPPELFPRWEDGQPHAAQVTQDVYALGVVMYNILVGVPASFGSPGAYDQLSVWKTEGRLEALAPVLHQFDTETQRVLTHMLTRQVHIRAEQAANHFEMARAWLDKCEQQLLQPQQAEVSYSVSQVH